MSTFPTAVDEDHITRLGHVDGDMHHSAVKGGRAHREGCPYNIAGSPERLERRITETKLEEVAHRSWRNRPVAFDELCGQPIFPRIDDDHEASFSPTSVIWDSRLRASSTPWLLSRLHVGYF
jgi:hypothetical protein